MKLASYSVYLAYDFQMNFDKSSIPLNRILLTFAPVKKADPSRRTDLLKRNSKYWKYFFVHWFVGSRITQ